MREWRCHHLTTDKIRSYDLQQQNTGLLLRVVHKCNWRSDNKMGRFLSWLLTSYIHVYLMWIRRTDNCAFVIMITFPDIWNLFVPVQCKITMWNKELSKHVNDIKLFMSKSTVICCRYQKRKVIIELFSCL